MRGEKVKADLVGQVFRPVCGLIVFLEGISVIKKFVVWVGLILSCLGLMTSLCLVLLSFMPRLAAILPIQITLSENDSSHLPPSLLPTSDPAQNQGHKTAEQAGDESLLHGQRLVLVSAKADTVRAEMWSTAQGVLRQRIQAWGLQAEIEQQDEVLIVRWSGDMESAWLQTHLLQPGWVEIIESGIEYPPLDGTTRIQTGPQARPDQGIYQTLLGPADFLAAQARPQGDDTFHLLLSLTEAGANHYQAFLAENYGIYICLVVDKVVVGCPILKSEGQRLDILPGPTQLFVDDLALSAWMNSGPLPLTLQIKE